MTKSTVFRTVLLYVLCKSPDFLDAQLIPDHRHVRSRRTFGLIGSPSNIQNDGLGTSLIQPQDTPAATFYETGQSEVEGQTYYETGLNEDEEKTYYQVQDKAYDETDQNEDLGTTTQAGADVISYDAKGQDEAEQKTDYGTDQDETQDNTYYEMNQNDTDGQTYYETGQDEADANNYDEPDQGEAQENTQDEAGQGKVGEMTYYETGQDEVDANTYYEGSEDEAHVNTYDEASQHDAGEDADYETGQYDAEDKSHDETDQYDAEENTFDETDQYNAEENTLVETGLKEVEDINQWPTVDQTKNEDMLAILHVGPKRTGTSTIQLRAQQLKSWLNKDGYFLPGQFADGSHPANMYRLATCFEKGDVEEVNFHPVHNGISCEPELIEAVSNVAESGSNLLISAERFSFSSVNVGSLKEELFDPYYKNVQVVMYYRRFYDWLISKWSSQHELPQYCNYRNDTRQRCTSLVDYMNDMENVKKQFQDDFTYSVYNRYAEYFDDVQVVNTYDIGTQDAAEYFFCDLLPDANEMCGKYISKAEPVQFKVRTPQIYRYLVVAAIELNLLNIPLTDKDRINDIAQLAQFRHEVKLGRSQYNFAAKDCPDDEALDFLLKTTLDAEEELFPKYFEKRGKFEIMRDFNRAKTTSLCQVDARAEIQLDADWQRFFQNVQQQL